MIWKTGPISFQATGYLLRFALVLVRQQKAHRFTVPEGEGAGVPPEDYAYMDYVDVPFEAWDIRNNRQLMISFRDQERDGAFNLIERILDDDISGREYFFVHAVPYNEDLAICRDSQSRRTCL